MYLCQQIITNPLIIIIMSYCGDKVFRNNVINALYGNLPTMLQNIISWRYDEMLKNTALPHNNWPQPNPPIPGVQVLTSKTNKDVLLKVNSSLFSGVASLSHIWGSPNIGHDLPTWMDEPLSKNGPSVINKKDTFDFDRKRIMIICQDPLRHNMPSKNMYFSSVFGMHSRDWRGNRMTTQIFNQLVGSENCCLYLTDYNKLYLNGSNVSSFASLFKTVLDIEIRLFKPDKIVTFGIAAGSAIIKKPFVCYPKLTTPTQYSYTSNSGKRIPVVPLYHPNARINKSYYSAYGSKVGMYVHYMK